MYGIARLAKDDGTANVALHTTESVASAAIVIQVVHRARPATPRLSRKYHNLHRSDVVLAAGIGTFSGLKVVRYSHAHPDNFVDRVILKTSIAPGGHGGGVIAWSVPLAH